MITFYFFYNITITTVYIVCCIALAYSYIQKKSPVFKYGFVMFMFYALSNLVYYMKEFLPTFETFYAQEFPFSMFILTLPDVLGLYFCTRVIMELAGLKVNVIYNAIWLVLVIGSCITTYPFIAVMVIVNASIIYSVFRLYRAGAEEGRNKTASFTTLLMGLIILCNLVLLFEIGLSVLELDAIQYTVESSYELIKRNPVVEASGIICVISAIWYLTICTSGGNENHNIISSQQFSIIDVMNKYDLTKREGEIARLVYEGKSNQEISETLFISVGTVKVHIHHIYEKFNVNSRYQFMAIILGNGTSVK